MERRERYDPEDIESLLSERGFDELLEEERAYVLRHLSDRNEYESMRGLLLHMRNERGQEGPLTADPRVREEVLAAYREQQRPQWRIWLNSLGTVLWPKEASAMWRPALAFGSLAVLVVLGVWLVGPNSPAVDRSAEVAATEGSSKQEEQPNAEPSRSTTVETREAANEQEALPKVDLDLATGDAEMARSEEMQVDELRAPVEERLAEVEKVRAPARAAADLFAEDIEPSEDRSLREQKASTPPPPVHVADEPAMAGATAPGSHVVTENELMMNQSVANVSEVSKYRDMVGRAKKEMDARGRNLGADPELVSLLSAGW